MIEIKLTRCRLFLSEQEMISLLKQNQDLWQTAIQRGKAVIRARKAAERAEKRLDHITYRKLI